MYNTDLINEFIDHYDDDMSACCGSTQMSYLDFVESLKYGILTEDDGTAHYLINGEDSGINAFIHSLPEECDGIVWYNK